MSNTVTKLCRPLRLSPAQKAVLMCLADYCHDNGRDWHSIPAIMGWTCLGRTAVIEAVKALESGLLLTIEKSPGQNNVMRLDLSKIKDRAAAHQSNRSTSRTSAAAEPVHLAEGTGTEAGPPPVRLATEPVRAADPKHQEASNMHLMPAAPGTATPLLASGTVKSTNRKSTHSINLKNEDPPGFQTFWTAYPRKVNRMKAIKEFRRIAPSEETLQSMLQAIAAQGLVQKRDRGEEQFIPHASTWLSQARWEDEQPTRLRNGYIGPTEGRLASGVAL